MKQNNGIRSVSGNQLTALIITGTERWFPVGRTAPAVLSTLLPFVPYLKCRSFTRISGSVLPCSRYRTVAPSSENSESGSSERLQFSGVTVCLKSRCHQNYEISCSSISRLSSRHSYRLMNGSTYWSSPTPRTATHQGTLSRRARDRIRVTANIEQEMLTTADVAQTAAARQFNTEVSGSGAPARR